MTVEQSWNRSWASYDSWRLAPPPEPKYDWDDFAQYVHDNPGCGWDPDDDSDLQAYAEMMEEQEAEARAESMAEDQAEARAVDDEAYWSSL